ncbi:hypothetical protein JX266_002576 [Neoarthrinium moseri]|nr:hypothetical protein JX266_002576 [Neoarthrinium moseri]
MSANIQESEAAFRRRSHDQFTDPAFKAEGAAAGLDIKEEEASAINGSLRDIPSVSVTQHDVKRERDNSPSLSSDSDLSSLRDSPSPTQMDLTPSTSPLAPGHKDSPSHPTADASKPADPSSTPTTSAQPATMPTSAPASSSASASASAKRKRKTPAEKEAEDRERAQKKAKREEELAAKAKEKEEKEAAKAKEKEEKDAAKAAKAAEKAAEKAKAQAEKDEKARKQKEEEEKKKRAQPSIFGFFKKPAALGEVSPNKQPASKLVDGSPIRPKAAFTATRSLSPSVKDVKPEKSAYEKLFQPFFIKSDVTVAPPLLQMDDETKAAKSRILDEHLRSERSDVAPRPFDPVAVFQFNGVPSPRGIEHPAVRKVMAEMFGDPLDNTSRTESQQVRFKGVQDQLNSIPVKILHFYEDVRPPYVGTVTATPSEKLRRLARCPIGRLLPLNYDYDSEAEWEEEEGEDLDDEEVEDEENEGEEEMADFLDDADDVAAARPAFLGETEPVSTGVCYENRKRLSQKPNGEDCATVYKYRMEFLLESLESHHSIDPFSTQYWKPKVAAVEPTSAQSKLTAGTKPAKSGMAPPPPPGSAPATSTSATAAAAAASQAQPDWSTLVPRNLLRDFKKAVVSSDINFLTKAGIVDMLSKRFDGATKNQVKATLDFVAERSAFPGEKKSAKRWVLRPEHALNKE